MGRDKRPQPIIWARPPRSGRGPQPSVKLEQIARKAVEIADQSGMEALTMRNLARELDRGTMSLYRYLNGKNDLIALMVDEVVGEVELVEHDDWREGLRWIARTIRAQGHRHPWFPLIENTGPFFGPRGIAFTEHMLGIVDGLGLNIDEMMSAVGLVGSYATGFVRRELALELRVAEEGMTTDEFMRLNAPYVLSLIESGKYPLFKRIIYEAEQPHMTPDENFEYGLVRVIQGIEAGLPHPTD